MSPTILRRASWLASCLVAAVAGHWFGGQRPSPEAPERDVITAPPAAILAAAEDDSKQRQSLAAWLGASGGSWEELAASLAKLPRDERLAKLRDLARWNPSAATDLAEALAKMTADHEPLAVALGAWVESDAESAAKRLRGLEADAQAELLPKLLAIVGEKNPFGIGGFMRSSDLAAWPKASLDKAAGAWAEREPIEAAGWIASLPEAEQLRLAKMHLRSFSTARGGLEAFLRSFGHLDCVGDANAMTLTLSYESSLSDPDEAMAFGKSIPNERARSLYLMAALQTIAIRDVRETMRLFDSDVPPENKKLVGGGLPVALGGNFAEVWSWMRSQPEVFGVEAAKSLIFRELVSSKAGPELRNAARELVDEWPTGQPYSDDLKGSVRLVVQGSVRRDEIDETLAWIDALPDPALKNDAKAFAADVLSEADPATASELLARLPPGEDRDDAVVTLVGDIPDDPERAMLWAATVSDAKKRAELTAKVLRCFWGLPPESAAKAITDSALPAAEKQQLLQRLRR